MSGRPWKLQWAALYIDKRAPWRHLGSFRTRESAERKMARVEQAWGRLYMFRVVKS